MGSEFNTTADIFECQLCGQCCNGFGGTYVTEQDILKISDYIWTDPNQFITRYCDITGTGPVLTQGPDACCIFFDTKKQCAIHPVKPRMCKAWPFLQTLVENPENWDAMASACPGMTPSVPFADIRRIVAAQIKTRGF